MKPTSKFVELIQNPNGDQKVNGNSPSPLKKCKYEYDIDIMMTLNEITLLFESMEEQLNQLKQTQKSLS